MAGNKTKPTKVSVTGFIKGIEDEQMRRDARKVAAMMREATGSRARMWGANIAPRKQALTLYVIPGFKHFESLMSKLGKYKTGKSCLYIRRLSDVDEQVLKRLIVGSVKYMRKHYATK